jgi:hypothetical protein
MSWKNEESPHALEKRRVPVRMQKAPMRRTSEKRPDLSPVAPRCAPVPGQPASGLPVPSALELIGSFALLYGAYAICSFLFTLKG